MTNARKLFPHLADIYIVDQNFHWTFVVTHEDALERVLKMVFHPEAKRRTMRRIMQIRNMASL